MSLFTHSSHFIFISIKNNIRWIQLGFQIYGFSLKFCIYRYIYNGFVNTIQRIAMVLLWVGE